jgi:hypothetical protein
MKNNVGIHDVLDLGLMTRILCHEMNNILASQQGFLKLLSRGHSDPLTLARWTSEVVQANQSLQDLVKAIQSLVHSDFDPEHHPDPLLEHTIEQVSHQALALGALIPSISLNRLLLLLVMRAEVKTTPLADWTVAIESGPIEAGVLSQCDPAYPYLSITLPFEVDPSIAQDMERAANRILPPPNSSRADWVWALILGLLRQHRGDLRLQKNPLQDQSPSGERLQVLIPLPARND